MFLLLDNMVKINLDTVLVKLAVNLPGASLLPGAMRIAEPEHHIIHKEIQCSILCRSCAFSI